ncbi:MAG: methyltransferase domain-containing protein [Gammaproteobacteria bacterium]|nr:methyltransferase domain-containing protein [Gammaproteobacteria bacterium]
MSEYSFPDRDRLDMNPPAQLLAIETATRTLGFNMASVPQTGALLRAQAAAKPASRILELGTGTGIATCWLLDGLDDDGQLVTVEIDPVVQQVAKIDLGYDARISFVEEDAASFLQHAPKFAFDLIFADALPGKFSELDDALSLLSEDGVYIVDDLLPQDNWPEGHAPKVPIFIESMMSRGDLMVEYWEWSSGILLARKSGA